MMKKRILFSVIFLFISGAAFVAIKGIGKEIISEPEDYITIPFKLYFNEIFFQASVNKSGPLWILLDSGASDFIMDDKCAEELNLSVGSIIDQGYIGVGEHKVFEKELKNICLEIQNSEIRMHDGAYASSFDMIEKILGHRVNAVCGRQLFEKYIVEIDYAINVIRLHNPKKFTYQGKGNIIPIIVDKVPYMKATVILQDNEEVEANFMIDTGLPDAFSFTSTFCRNNNLDRQIETIQSIRIGAGGSSENRIGRMKAIVIGGYEIDNPLASLSSDSKGRMSHEDIGGLIGNEILKRFKVFFDYANSRMILEPSGSFNSPMEWDMTGLFLYTAGSSFDKINIFKVLPGSPAHLANIKEGDQLDSIDGIKAGNYSIDEISKMFKTENAQYRLGIIREGKNLEVKMNTKRMI